MSNKFVPLEEAAELLGITSEKLVAMRSGGELRGFKDGASWKFPQTEIDRLLAEGIDGQGGSDDYAGFSVADSGDDLNMDDEDGAAVLASEQGASSGSRIIGGSNSGDDDLALAEEDSDAELNLVDSDANSHDDELTLASREPSTGGSDLDLANLPGLDSSPASPVASDSGINPPKVSLNDDEELGLLDDSGPELSLGHVADSALGSSNDVLSDLNLDARSQGGDSLIHGDSTPSGLDLGSGRSPLSDLSELDDALSNDDDLMIADDDDDIVLDELGSGSGILESGIDLMQPSDSGLSLESEPLNLAGSGISVFDLGSDVSSGDTPGSSPIGSDPSPADGSGSLVDFQADEEFQLSPSGVGLEIDDDSASQVIDIEHSDAFGSVDVDEGAFDDGAFVDPSQGDGRGWAQRNELLADDAQGIDDASLMEEVVETPIMDSSPAAKPTVLPPSDSVPYSVWNVVSLASILVFLSLGGMLASDLIRNLWTYSEPTSPISSLGETVLSALGLNG